MHTISWYLQRNSLTATPKRGREIPKRAAASKKYILYGIISCYFIPLYHTILCYTKLSCTMRYYDRPAPPRRRGLAGHPADDRSSHRTPGRDSQKCSTDSMSRGQNSFKWAFRRIVQGLEYRATRLYKSLRWEYILGIKLQGHQACSKEV